MLPYRNHIDLPLVSSGVSPAARLNFIDAPINAKQPRLAGRFAWKPDIRIKDFEFSAVIDWIELRFTSLHSTNFNAVQREVVNATGVREPYVEALNSGPGNAATEFRVRIQAPESTQILEAARALQHRFTRGVSVDVVSLEVSVDFRPRVPSSVARSQMVGVLQRTILPGQSVWAAWHDEPRYAMEEKATHLFEDLRKTAPGSFHDVYRQQVAPVDLTYYLGAQSSTRQIRIMDKVTDERNPATGAFSALPESKKRARIEVTLREPELRSRGLITVDDLMRFPFARLQGDFFKFRLPTFTDWSVVPPSMLREAGRWLERMEREQFLRAGVVGLEWLDQSRDKFRMPHLATLRSHLKRKGERYTPSRRGRGAQKKFVAYGEMNDAVQTALQCLARKMSRL